VHNQTRPFCAAPPIGAPHLNPKTEAATSVIEVGQDIGLSHDGSVAGTGQ